MRQSPKSRRESVCGPSGPSPGVGLLWGRGLPEFWCFGGHGIERRRNVANEGSGIAQADEVGGVVRKPKGRLRWMMIGMIFLGFTILYIDRANLSAAAPQIKEEFALSQTEMGLILSGFFWTYAIFQLISGWFVDRFGTRIGYTVAAGLWSSSR